MQFYGTLAEINDAMTRLLYLSQEDYFGPDVLRVQIRDRPVDETDSKQAERMVQFYVRPVNDEPLVTVSSKNKLLYFPGNGESVFTVGVMDDQYLNTSTEYAVALQPDDTHVRVWLYTWPTASFTLNGPTAGLTVAQPQPYILRVDGPIDDVNDALIDISMTLNAAVPWGTAPWYAVAVAHILAEDYGAYGFCSCTDLPGQLQAPVTSCNKYTYANHSALVLDCFGTRVVERLYTIANVWWYGEVPLIVRFNDLDGDGQGDRDFALRPVVYLGTPETDDRSDWSIFDPAWSIGAGPFVRPNDTATNPCPLTTSASLGTDLNAADLSRQVFLRSYFYVPYGVIGIEVDVISDRDAALYINGDLVYEHKVPAGTECPVTTTHRLDYWFSPDFAAKYNEDGTKTVVNEIGLMGHNRTAYLDAHIRMRRCTGNQGPQCHNRPCTVTAQCYDVERNMSTNMQQTRGCFCSTEVGVASVYNYDFAAQSTSVKVGRCIPYTCGNGVVDADWEECDDGNTDPNDSCDNQCRRVVSSGRCLIKQYTLDTLRQMIAEAQGDEARLKYLGTIQQQLECWQQTASPDCLPSSPDAGYDALFRYCDGQCAGSASAAQPCQPTWRQREVKGISLYFIAACDCAQRRTCAACAWQRAASRPSRAPAGARARTSLGATARAGARRRSKSAWAAGASRWARRTTSRRTCCCRARARARAASWTWRAAARAPAFASRRPCWTRRPRRRTPP